MTLRKQLETCEHKLVSVGIADSSDLKICFDCGSTKRDSETAWFSPWIWRKTS